MLFIALGILLLYFGAEALVRGSSSVAQRAGIPPLIVGLTVVAFGTSAPELTVSLSAALTGHTDVAVGNVIGSNIFNIAVILALSALIYPPRIHVDLIRRDIPIMIVVSGLAFLCVLCGGVSRLAGCGLVAGLVIYLFASVRSSRGSDSNEVDELTSELPSQTRHPVLDWLAIGGGLALLVLGSHWFVEGATLIARSLGVSEAVIGLTIVAAGTSLPELATSVLAAFRRHSDIAVGNIVGSNIFNSLGILGLTAVVHPLHSEGVRWTDGAVMLGFSLLLLPLAFTGKRLSRTEGVVFLAGYALYMVHTWDHTVGA